MVAKRRSAASSAAFLDGRRAFAPKNRFDSPSGPMQNTRRNILSMTAEPTPVLSFAVDSVDGASIYQHNPFAEDVPTTIKSINSMVLSAVEPSTVFEPILPDKSALVAMGSVLVLCVMAGFVWSNEVVPVSRTKLAISKSRGEVKQYLDGLKEGALSEVEPSDDDGSESTEVAVAMVKSEDGTDNIVKPNVGDGRDIERWLFSDWLNSSANRKAGRQKEPAVPVLKDAKWNSGDNPVLVTSALIGLGVIIASVTERVVR